MQSLEHYVRLYSRLTRRSPESAAEGAYGVTLPELAEPLHCSERNVKSLLQGMRRESWIAWRPGRGRGGARVCVCCPSPRSFLRSIRSVCCAKAAKEG
ncbi:SgrR family transcriptional regulator [Paenibacillus sp. P26]|nr:SgrR family transcriptional regulator [Paenibacillus sp. P26]